MLVYLDDYTWRSAIADELRNSLFLRSDSVDLRNKTCIDIRNSIPGRNLFGFRGRVNIMVKNDKLYVISLSYNYVTYN